MDGDGFRDRRTPRLVGAENDTLNVPIMLADARGRLKEKLSANSSYTDPVHRAGLSELELYLINSLTFITNML